MWIDEVVMCSPLSPRSCTAREEVIIEDDCTDDFIRGERTLESNRPPTTTIHVTTEVDEESLISFEYIFDHIDQVSLAYSTEFQKYISVQSYPISYQFDISIVSVSNFILSTFHL